MKLFAAALVAGLLVGQAVVAEDFSIPVNKDFSEEKLDWGGGLGKGMIFRWNVINHNGLIAVCGVGQFPDSRTQMASKDILRTSFVSMNGKVFFRDLSFFARVPMTTDLAKAKATCRDTGTKVPKGHTDILLTLHGYARF